MYDDYYEHFINKKRNKEKTLVFSFINNLIINLFDNDKLDILRFDIRDFSSLFNYKDIARISADDILPLLKYSIDALKLNNSKKLLAVDLPITEIYYNSSYSLDKIINYYYNSKADILVINYDHVINDMVNKLSKLKIPVIIFCKNSEAKFNEKQYNNLLEAESMGALMVILENFTSSFVQKLKNSFIIPVITNDLNLKSDGYYARFTSVFGYINDNNKKYLNLYDIIKDSINDCISDIQKN